MQTQVKDLHCQCKAIRRVVWLRCFLRIICLILCLAWLLKAALSPAIHSNNLKFAIGTKLVEVRSGNLDIFMVRKNPLAPHSCYGSDRNMMMKGILWFQGSETGQSLRSFSSFHRGPAATYFTRMGYLIVIREEPIIKIFLQFLQGSIYISRYTKCHLIRFCNYCILWNI